MSFIDSVRSVSAAIARRKSERLAKFRRIKANAMNGNELGVDPDEAAEIIESLGKADEFETDVRNARELRDLDAEISEVQEQYEAGVKSWMAEKTAIETMIREFEQQLKQRSDAHLKDRIRVDNMEYRLRSLRQRRAQVAHAIDPQPVGPAMPRVS